MSVLPNLLFVKGYLTLFSVYRLLWGIINPSVQFSSVQFSSVAQSCPTLCDPRNCSTPGLRVRHQLPEFIQTHVHQVGDAIQPSHPLLSPSPPAPNPSQHQGISSHQNLTHLGQGEGEVEGGSYYLEIMLCRFSFFIKNLTFTTNYVLPLNM